MRRTIHLNYDWDFIDHYDESKPTDESQFLVKELVDIPHTIKEVPFSHYDPQLYELNALYHKKVSLDEIKKDEHIFLRFYGVATKATVYFNHHLLGVHEGGYTPFSFDITSEVAKLDQPIFDIYVCVDSSEIENIPPFGNVVDYLGYGGIYREVEIEIIPKYYIEDVAVKTREALQLSEDAMTLDLRVNLMIEGMKNPRVEVSVLDGNKAIYNHMYDEVAPCFTRQETHQPITRWSVDCPKLYLLVIKLYSKNSLQDEVEIKFGYRDARFTEDGFILNNQKLKLMGLNRHQSYPYVGYAMPKTMQEADADFLKFTLGCNIVRTSHYMQSDHFINRCDEIGLLVFEEIPGWQYIGNAEFKERSYQNLREMIQHHKNHPSIVLWGTRINESPDDHDFYEKLSELSMELDDSRQNGGVRNFAGSELLEDVYTYNDFSHIGNNPGLENPLKITRKLVPYLVSEHNGHIFPTKKSDPLQKREEQALRHMNVLDSMMKYPMINGAIGWCMSDYNTHKDFGSGDRICHHGVSDMFRIPKYASYTYASQQDKYPVLEVLSNMNIGEYPRSVIPSVTVMSNCDYIKIYHNEQEINTFYSDYDLYRYVKHAPIIVDDFIGKQLVSDGLYKKNVANMIKKVLISYNHHGMAMPLKDKLTMLNLMMFHKFTMNKAMEIYGKYLGNWGTEHGKYRFDGYINDELVISKTVGQTKEFILNAKIDHPTLHHKDTYDATRIVVSLEDEHGNTYPFANHVVNITTTKELAVLGPKSTALNGGSTGFYVRTKEKGKAKITISCPGFEDIKIAVEIK
ncbi:MAG: glycoside hydrolase family 2 TIM barrel-domain containing protein [Candidatus Izemoplasmatales bacterium]